MVRTLSKILLASVVALLPRAALAQDNPPPQPPATTPPADPAPASASDPKVEVTPPSVSVSAPNLKQDEVTADEKEGEKKEKKALKFAGSTFFIQTGINPDVIDRKWVWSPTPSVETFALFMPRWALSKDWQLRGRATFVIEWTNNANDSNVTKREPRFGDTTLTLAYRGIPEFKKIKTVLLANLGVPTSPESRARTMIVAPGVSAGLSRTFEKVAKGEVNLAGTLGYTHPLYSYTTPGYSDFILYRSDPRPYSPACVGGDNSCVNQMSGVANTSDVLSWFVSASGEWGKWSPSLFFLMSHQFLYHFKDVPGAQPGNDPTHTRQSTYFIASLDYAATPWISPEIGYSMSRSILSGDGTYGNPFFSKYQDVRVFLGANILLDKLYEAATGTGDKDSGAAHARAKRPVLAL